MKLNLFDTVVLEKDILDLGLKCGDVGAVVEVYKSGGLEVEFVTGSGRTQALVTLSEGDVRLFSDSDILAARPLHAA